MWKWQRDQMYTCFAQMLFAQRYTTNDDNNTFYFNSTLSVESISEDSGLI